MDLVAALGYLVQLLLAGGMLGAVIFYVVTWYGSRDFFRLARRGSERVDTTAGLPGVTVLKPLKGLDVDLYENLATFCRQDYPRFQIIFGVADARDPAVTVVRRLQRAHPGVRIDLVIDSWVYGTNYKVSNLHNMYQVAVHEVIVIADSDIRVCPDYLRRVVAPLADPQVGVVTCLYRAVSTGGLPTLLESLFINTDFSPMVLVARVVEQPSYAFGATMAMRRATLEEVGGFLPLANYLADDYHLGHRVAACGYQLVLSDVVVDTVLAVGSWRRLVDHQLRWARTYRNCRPRGYFASIFTHGTMWATANLLYQHFSPSACVIAASMYALRISIAWIVARRYLVAPLRRRDALLVPFKDLFVSFVWLICFLGDTVQWSGYRFRVRADGRMVRVPSGPVAPEAVPAYAATKERDRRAASI